MRYPASLEALEPHHRPLTWAASAAFLGLQLFPGALADAGQFSLLWLLPGACAAGAAISATCPVAGRTTPGATVALRAAGTTWATHTKAPRVTPIKVILLALAVGWFLSGTVALRSEHTAALGAPRIALPQSEVTGSGSILLSGRVLDDSSERRGGVEHYRLSLGSVTYHGGQRIPASGEFELRVTDGPGAVAGSGFTVSLPHDSFSDPSRSRTARREALTLTPPARLTDRLRGTLRSEVVRTLRPLGPEAGGLARALLLGSREALDPALVERIRKSGGMHLLALSGMHLGLIAAVVASMLHPLLGRPAVILVTLLLLLYYWLVGPIPSLLRALLMFSLASLLRLSGRRSDPKSLLAGALLLGLLIAPDLATSLGWRLSTLALAGILWVGLPVARLLPRLPGRRIGSLLAVSLGALLATTPLTLAVFGEAYPVSLLSSLLLTPLVFAAMLLSLASLGLLPLFPALTPVVQGGGELLYRSLETLAGRFAAAAPLSGSAGGGVWLAVSAAVLFALLLPWVRFLVRTQRVSCG